jgi:hypothetical protein
MKKLVVGLIAVGLLLSLGTLSFAASAPTHPYKVGDRVFVCGCAEGCDCDTISRKPCQCSCGKDLVAAKVTGVSHETVTVKADNWEKARVLKTAGGYRCTHGKGCSCDTMSQKPAKCPCGDQLRK